MASEPKQDQDINLEIDSVNTKKRVADGVAKIGERLGQAREMRNYGIKEVATELNLAPSVVSALEVGDMERLPEMTYIRGYLRAYARLLGLSDELDNQINSDLVDSGMYEESSASRFIVSDGSPLSNYRNSGGGLNLIRPLLFIIPVLIIGGAIWLVTQRSDLVEKFIQIPDISSGVEETQTDPEEPEIEVESVIESNEVADNNTSIPRALKESASGAAASLEQSVDSAEEGIDYAVSDILSTNDGDSAQLTEAEAVTGNLSEDEDVPQGNLSPGVGESAVERLEEEAEINEALESADAIRRELEEENAQDDQDSDEAAESEVSSTDEEAVATANTTSARLVITLTSDSWVEVKGSNGKNIVKRLAREGETITANGSAPMSIILGNASGASVTFDGETVDLDAHKTGNVARFSVGD